MAREIMGVDPRLATECNETLAQINAAIGATPDLWRRKILTNWRDHYWAEVIGDLEGIMATLAPDPVYRFYGTKALGGSSEGGSNTTEEARAMYAGLIDMGFRPAGPLKDMKFAPADWGLMAQFTMTAIYPGAILHLPDREIDPKASYRLSVDLMESHPYAREHDGLMGGETVFMSEPRDIVRV